MNSTEMNNTGLPEILTVKQVAEWLDLHRVTVLRLAKVGKLPARRIGNEFRFSRAALAELFAGSKEGAKCLE